MFTNETAEHNNRSGNITRAMHVHEGDVIVKFNNQDANFYNNLIQQGNHGELIAFLGASLSHNKKYTENGLGYLPSFAKLAQKKCSRIIFIINDYGLRLTHASNDRELERINVNASEEDKESWTVSVVSSPKYIASAQKATEDYITKIKEKINTQAQLEIFTVSQVLEDPRLKDFIAQESKILLSFRESPYSRELEEDSKIFLQQKRYPQERSEENRLLSKEYLHKENLAILALCHQILQVNERGLFCYSGIFPGSTRYAFRSSAKDSIIPMRLEVTNPRLSLKSPLSLAVPEVNVQVSADWPPSSPSSNSIPEQRFRRFSRFSSEGSIPTPTSESKQDGVLELYQNSLFVAPDDISCSRSTSSNDSIRTFGSDATAASSSTLTNFSINNKEGIDMLPNKPQDSGQQTISNEDNNSPPLLKQGEQSFSANHRTASNSSSVQTEEHITLTPLIPSTESSQEDPHHEEIRSDVMLNNSVINQNMDRLNVKALMLLSQVGYDPIDAALEIAARSENFTIVPSAKRNASHVLLGRDNPFAHQKPHKSDDGSSAQDHQNNSPRPTK